MNKPASSPKQPQNTYPNRISRRRLLSSVPALGGLLVTGGCSDALMPPTIRGGLIGMADVLTMSTNRWLLANQPLAREYQPSDITLDFPQWHGPPRSEAYQQLVSSQFSDWRLGVTGLVERPLSLTLEDLKHLPARTQITAHVCEQGWSAIGQWTGTPLLRVLEAAGGVTEGARYVVIDTFDGWYEGYDMFEVVHPQTILAYGLNGKDLPIGNGAPVRLRVERQCGYKSLKWLKSIQVVDSMVGFGKGTGGINSDWGFHWYGGV
ncbi:MAG: molybdopterin-dependent oxidoreductase [Acidobacteriota bacterium]|nr:molybdopterin-dependent oxidoreductase [Acidobacteriota bacterium]